MLAITVAAALGVTVAVLVVRSHRRAVRERRRLAALTGLAETIERLTERLRVPSTGGGGSLDVAHATPAARVAAPRVGALPGRAALLDHLSDQVVDARASGVRLVLTILSIERSGSGEGRLADVVETLARLTGAPVYRAGDTKLALVLPDRGRAEALSLIARAEAELGDRRPGARPVIVESVAVELETGDDALALLTRAAAA